MSEPGAPAFRRLHPASLVLGVFLRLRQVAVPVLVPALVVGNGGVRGPHAHRWFIVIAVAAALVIVLAVAEYLALRFALAPDALVIRSGVLRRVTRSIPYARIQGVSTAQTLPQRLLGVGTLRVDTGAGGLVAEAELASLQWGEVQALRETLVRARQAWTVDAAGAEGGALAVAVPAEDAPSAAMPRAAMPDAASAVPTQAVPLAVVDDEELLVAGATSMQLLVILGAAVGVLQRLGDDWVELFVSDAVRDVATRVPTGGAAGLLLGTLAAVLALSVLAVLWLGVVVVTWVRYRGFRLSRVGGALVREYGLLHRRTASTPVSRVQAVKVRETPVRRLAGRAEVRLQSAGAMAVSSSGDEPDVPVLLPIVRTGAAAAAVAHVYPGVRADVAAAAPVPGWRRASRRSWVRTGAQWTVTLLAALAVLSVLLGGGVWRLLWLLPVLWALTPLAWRARGVGADGAYLVVREGALSRTTWVLPVAKLQQVQLRQGPLQRWMGLATVRLTTAGLGGVADVVDLPVADARMLVDDLVARLPALRRRRSAPPAPLPVPSGAHVS
ncbi:MAG: PH domain-containing protein [Gemmatimonadetes bacterium]|nr:PH domain-containing protein [Gemmatimonadota bacterium]